MQIQKQLISHLLGSEHALMRHLFDPLNSLTLRSAPDVIFTDAWELNEEQRILVLAALDVWGSCGNVFLWELLNGLGDQNLTRLITVLTTWRDLKKRAAVEPAQGQNP